MNGTNHKTMLSEHFSLEEFTYSRIAVENALDNVPPVEAKSALQHLVTCLLEPLRQLYKAPIAILSGYRSENGKPSGGWCSCEPAPERGSRGLLCCRRSGEAAFSFEKFGITFRSSYFVQTPSFPASFIEKEGEKSNAGAGLYGLCDLFVIRMWYA